jgi:hypothetical protein
MHSPTGEEAKQTPTFPFYGLLNLDPNQVLLKMMDGFAFKSRLALRFRLIFRPEIQPFLFGETETSCRIRGVL